MQGIRAAGIRRGRAHLVRPGAHLNQVRAEIDAICFAAAPCQTLSHECATMQSRYTQAPQIQSGAIADDVGNSNVPSRFASSGQAGFQPKPIPQSLPAAPLAPQAAPQPAAPPYAMQPQPNSRQPDPNQPPPRVGPQQGPHDGDEAPPLWLILPWILAAIAPVVGWHASRIERMYDPALPARDTWVGGARRYTSGEGALPTYASPGQLAAQAQAAKRAAVQTKHDKGADKDGNSMLGIRLKGAEYLSGSADAPAHTGARWNPQRRNFTDVIKDDKGA